MQDLPANVELAVKDVIDAGALGIITAIGQTKPERPGITIYAQLGEERPNGFGNFMVTVTASLRSSATATSEQQHKLACNQVFGLLMVDNLAEVLSNYPALCVFSGLGELERSGRMNCRFNQTREDDDWLSEMSFELYCCLTDIA